MTKELLVSIITVSGSIIAAAVTFYLTKRHEMWAKWQQEKLAHYKALLSALSDMTGGDDDGEAGRQWRNAAAGRFAQAMNTIALVAPQYVIDAIMSLACELSTRNQDRLPEREARLRVQMLLAIRRDIGLSSGDNANTFVFLFAGSVPPPERKADPRPITVTILPPAPPIP